jgi:hypothetical protein
MTRGLFFSQEPLLQKLFLNNQIRKLSRLSISQSGSQDYPHAFDQPMATFLFYNTLNGSKEGKQIH